MKFSQSLATLALGTEAERPIELPRPGRDPFLTIARPISGTQESLVLEAARAYAKAKGVELPREGEPLYDLAVMAHTIAIACVDPDSDPKDREPSFDGGAQQILDNLGPEEIAYLYERQQLWQDELSPTVSRMSTTELMGVALKLTEAKDDAPFSRLRPVLRLILLRTMAGLLFSSPEFRSQFSSASGSAGETSPKTP